MKKQKMQSQKNDHKLLYSIILPVYNQQKNLPIITYLIYQQCVSQNRQQINIQLIIVEDNSPDNTREIAHQLKQFYALKGMPIKVHQRPGKLGLGSAYRDASQIATGDFIIIMDADFSHHPKYISQMIQKQKEQSADIVTSTRYVPGAGVEGWTFMRKLTSRVANFIASWVLGSNFSDLTGSFRLYKKQVFQQLITKITTKGYAFQMQMLIRAWKAQHKIIEQPIIFVDRIYGQSKLGPNQVYLYLKGMGKLFLCY